MALSYRTNEVDTVVIVMIVIEVILFFAIWIILYFTLYKYIKNKQAKDNVKIDFDDAMIGKQFKLLESTSNNDKVLKHGKISNNGVLYQVLPNNENINIEQGSVVKVEAIRGSTLLVSGIKEK
ncbi:NfeD-like partner-binding protein [Mycoplasma testudineum]|uniref:NfeD-like partner-binding protein n=1 Tax=Mycoplasma testudineum TaxID=244584 RepID=A0A4R6IFE0_9MOLU|nr:NfeD family protein [Mycoplasma testudineum]TDO21060.1 NfeD-like partner-binding protein [Mycoplasma testudineum]